MKKFRTGVVGAGFVGIIHIEALRRLGNVEVVALCDAFNPNKKAEDLFIEHSYSDYKKMIDEENLDFIHICTPNSTHFEIAMYAMEQNVNIVLEKPMTFTLEESKILVELSNKKDLICGVNFHNRFYPACAYIRDVINKGEIGEVISINGMYVQDWLLYDTDYSWRLNSSKSGKTRTVADIGSHWIDLVEYMTNDKVVEVNASFKTVHKTRKKPLGEVLAFSTEKSTKTEDVTIDTKDIVTLMFKMNNGGIGTALFTQMCAGKKNTIDVLIGGTKASAEWKLDNHSNVVIGHRDKANEVITKDHLLMNNVSSTFDYPAGHTEGYADAFKQVFREIYNNPAERRYATFYDGYRQMLINEKVFESAQNATWVKVKD